MGPEILEQSARLPHRAATSPPFAARESAGATAKSVNNITYAAYSFGAGTPKSSTTLIPTFIRK
jgi:hypothetical protein